MTEVFFAEISLEMIQGYVETGSPMDKAGSYGIQDGIGTTFVRAVNGCYWNVTGFPVHRFSKELLALLEQKLL